MESFIYKICLIDEWENAKKMGEFRGTKKDLIDGYIHLSKGEQLNSTLKKHFFNQNMLVLLKVEVLNLENLKWEKSQTEDIFPHLYSILELKNIKNVFKIILSSDGKYKLPSNL
jgi:uncharacterized protein (DUF952 family)|tara:strand:- start:618 stop:959 length:342 start_codon:yes stop_codon:yes gene_type:complete